MGRARERYQPRRAEASVLHRIIREHLDDPRVLSELRRPAHDRACRPPVDNVIPFVQVREWVLTLPYRLRYVLAWDHGLSHAVLAIHTRALGNFYRQQAR